MTAFLDMLNSLTLPGAIVCVAFVFSIAYIIKN